MTAVAVVHLWLDEFVSLQLEMSQSWRFVTIAASVRLAVSIGFDMPETSGAEMARLLRWPFVLAQAFIAFTVHCVLFGSAAIRYINV
jgi:hypothetical protein